MRFYVCVVLAQFKSTLTMFEVNSHKNNMENADFIQIDGERNEPKRMLALTMANHNGSCAIRDNNNRRCFDDIYY